MSDLNGFPTVILPADLSVFRGHGFRHFPNFFSCEGLGRFDLSHPDGTMYLAEDELGMFLEGYRDSTDFTDADALERGMSRFLVQGQPRLADCTALAAAAFGVPDWIHDTPPKRTTAAPKHGHERSAAKRSTASVIGSGLPATAALDCETSPYSDRAARRTDSRRT